MSAKLSTIVTLQWVLAGATALHAGPIVTHIYDLNGTYADALGGPALVPNGGTLGATGYTFGLGQGPSLSGAIDPANYSIELRFHINDVSGWRKLIDFKNRSSDFGLYDNSGALAFYNVGIPQGAPMGIKNGIPTHLVITRHGPSGQFTAFLDGLQQLTFADSSGFAVFDGPGSIVHLLRDDQLENPSGFLDLVRIYDGALTSEDVLSLYNGGPPPGSSQVPEPASGLMLGIGALGMGWIARRRRVPA